jgi:hypothetical protein
MTQVFTNLSKWNVKIVPSLEKAYVAIDALLAEDNALT